MIQILSDALVDIEKPFRVSAGPGAGKTFWLLNHIKQVLHESKRLEKARKIICITYTNVAAETIISRLGDVAERVEVSTIHGFLYKHLLKPFLPVLEKEFELNAQEVDGHDDTILSNYSFLNDWKTQTRQHHITDDVKLAKAFRELRWKFENGNLVVKPTYPQKINGYNVKTDSYLVYKHLAWKQGITHHDDVLFFSYQLIKKHPMVLKVLRSKFPYFFIDEFQDTNPIQIEVIREIAKQETVIGIIGDEAQSIYGFQGADYKQFHSFTLPGLIDYQIADNRRSTNAIIKLLNVIRPALKQNEIRKVEGSLPIIFVGTMNKAIEKAVEISKDINVYTLSRDNMTSNVMRRHLDGTNFDDRLIAKLLEIDPPTAGNKYRSKEVVGYLRAVELAKQKQFKEAIKEAESLYPKRMDRITKRKLALSKISFLLKNYDSYKDKSAYDFFSFLKNNGSDISNMRNGAPKIFYDTNTYVQLALCVKITEDTSLHRTIHKAKGAEFKSAMLILNEENNIDFLLNPDLEKEEHRISYVAVSRARDNLFINVPKLSSESQKLLEPIATVNQLQN